VALEGLYYEHFNSSYVKILDNEKEPVIEITETGILTADRTSLEVDIDILRAGFDSGE
jgi:hypothetical protein